MLLQGNLQMVFDALYMMGVIDPVLKMDWKTAYLDLPIHYHQVEQAVTIANQHQATIDELIFELSKFDEKSLSFLAMEVAREFSDFHSCKQVH